MTGQPRKVIVASLMFGPYGKFPGLAERLSELESFVDEMAEESKKRFEGRTPDLIALPEVIVCGGLLGSAKNCSVALEGPVFDMFSRKAAQHGSYITIPLFLIENEAGGIYRNSLALVDRTGSLSGIYHKFHPVIGHDGETLEGGVRPGTEFPVFDCDFGRLGLQICFDISFDDGWAALGQSGAELVAWSTQSPATARPSSLAARNRYFILSSTWRNNLSLFEPTGMVAAQVKEPKHTLVEEIDLSYVILPWSMRLQKGALLTEMYGPKVGFRYYESEDCGIFWSNDRDTPIAQMVEEAGLETIDELHARNAAKQRAERG